jgi:hypothetical protein
MCAGHRTTATGNVTVAVESASMTLFFIGRIAGPWAANCTFSTIGDGMPPACRTVTTVCVPLVATSWMDASTRPCSRSVVPEPPQVLAQGVVHEEREVHGVGC